MSRKRNAAVQLSKDHMPPSDDEEEEQQQQPAQLSESGMPMASQEELRKRKCVNR